MRCQGLQMRKDMGVRGMVGLGQWRTIGFRLDIQFALVDSHNQGAGLARNRLDLLQITAIVLSSTRVQAWDIPAMRVYFKYNVFFDT